MIYKAKKIMMTKNSKNNLRSWEDGASDVRVGNVEQVKSKFLI